MQRAITRALSTRSFTHNVLSRVEVVNAMEDYYLQRCYLCGFDLNNQALIPFRESIEFCLRKLYMTEYCRNVYQASPAEKSVLEQWSEKKFVSIWLEAMEKINSDQSHFTETEIIEEKQKKMHLSFYIAHCCLVIRETHPHRKMSIPLAVEEDLINILNDVVVVHHCHYTGTVHGPVHKRCNSRVKIPTKHLKINIYAHNASAFDNQFVIKGINVSLLAQKGQPIPYLNLMGDSSDHIKIIHLGDCTFKDSFKLFESSLEDLCKIKSVEEAATTAEMVAQFLTSHDYFLTVFEDMAEHEKERLMTLLNGKGYFCYDYLTIRKVLSETTLPPI